MLLKLLFCYTRWDSAHGYFPLEKVLTTLHYHFIFQKVESVHSIDSETYYVYRYSQEARSALMDVTRGDETVLSDGNISQILALAKEKFHQELSNEKKSLWIDENRDR